MKITTKTLLVAVPALSAGAAAVSCSGGGKPTPPNIIVIMTDDQGYQDLGCYGSPLIKTPAIDKMASEGLRLTDFYQSSSVSSASRAGLLSGRMNTRNGVPGVYFPGEGGFSPDEITIAEKLKESGYATACYGKWHLGDAAEYMPLNQGFDEYFGIPYSNDMYMSPFIEMAEDVVLRNGWTRERAIEDGKAAGESRKAAYGRGLRDLAPLVSNDKIVEYPCDQTTLTRRYFDRAIEFMKRNKESGQPSFIYLTPAMPHTPLFASDQFLGTSERGLYGDCVEEIDWNVGRLLDMLDSEGLSENTLVVYTSDNGPWLYRGEDGGSAAPLRDGKFTIYEGGVRVPCIIRWSGKIKAGEVSDAVIRSIDFLPTFTHYAGGEVTHSVDGRDVSSFLEDTSKDEGLDEYTYVRQGLVLGVRKGDWVYLPYSGGNIDINEKSATAELFNLKEDISEGQNLVSLDPESLAQMKRLYERAVNSSK